ncbi:hypothetical protein BGX27_005439 [Mortierella sp. AM989]|nr:hypothetical protein BGX27_005439 [Mortierella sp. AM989]
MVKILSSIEDILVQSIGEFLGTAMYLFLAIGGADSITRGLGYGGLAILGTSFAFGISLIVVAWAFFRISGSHFNPAVSLMACITGNLSVVKFACYFMAQILGGMAGVGLARGVTSRHEKTLQVNYIMNNESIARAFFLEFFLTMILCLVYYLCVYEKNRGTFMAAFPYGITLFSCHLFATRYTNASINPARAFAASVAAGSFSKEHWVFWFGPLTGGIVAAGLAILFRFVDYDQYTAGIDAENRAQCMRAKAAQRNGRTASTTV